MVFLEKNTSIFQMKDIRQTRSYVLFLQKTGWQVIKKRNVYYFRKKILPFFTIIKLQRPEKIDIDYIKKMTRTKGIINIIIEPKNNSQKKKLENLGFRKVNPYLPSKTLLLDLKNKNLFSTFKKDCRYAIKKTKDAKIEVVKDAELFQKSWRRAVNYRRHVPSVKNLTALQESFDNKSLFLMHKENNALSGAVFLRTKRIAYYWQAFTNKEARKKLVQYKIVWEGIKWATKNNCSYFDFEGIYDKRFPNKSWLGFSHFKRSFGGSEIFYPGALSTWKVNFF